MTPTDQINVLIAERVMGWEIFERNEWEQHHSPFWRRDSSNYPYVDILVNEDRRLLVWRDSASPEGYDPLNDERATHTALAKMREDGWVVSWHDGGTGHYVDLKRWDKKAWQRKHGFAPTFTEAACKAMIAATNE